VKKKSPLSTLLLIAVIIVAGYAVYRFVYKPMMDKRTMNQALEKGCEAVAQKLEEQKEEIAEDLEKFAALIDQAKEMEELEGQESEEAAK